MKLLFLHPNQPSQFKLPAIAFASDPANEVVMLSQKNLEVKLPGVKVVGFGGNIPEGQRTNAFARKFNEACHRARDVASACVRLRRQGFVPDVIVAHSGWGDGMYLRAVLPQVPQLHYMEFWFRPEGADLGFDPRLRPGADIRAARSTDNAVHASNFFDADWCLTPTFWQKSVHPLEMHPKMSVLHEGVDTELAAPRDWPVFELADGRVLDPRKDEIITHVERHFDRYRGFPTFLEAIDIIQKRRPRAHVLVVGKAGAGYSGQDREQVRESIRQAPFDRARTHFLGHLDYARYLKVLQVSSAHIYLTYPFVLSWSFMEAMAVGCPIACSDSAPVRELAEDGRHCLSFDFFDATALADCIDRLLDDRELGRRLGQAARQRIVEQYDVRDLQPMTMQLIRDVAANGRPATTAPAIAEWNRRWRRDDPDWQRQVGLFQPTLP